MEQRLSASDYQQLPSEPGVYKFLNKSGHIIYVGKAKSISKRVASYFSKNVTNLKTKKLVQEIHYIEFVIVNSEFDALLLENNLIKENKPKYNILLKDDKTFPSICIAKERFPRIYATRHIDPKIGEYFGPYTSVKAMNGVLDLIRKLYKIRTCTLNLTHNNISRRKFKVCLEYHIGNCLGPCEGLQSEEDYLADVHSARKILSGKIHIVKDEFKNRMSQASSSLNFEVAQSYKEKIDLLDKFQIKSLVVNPNIGDIDVFGVIATQTHYYVNYMQISQGAITLSETKEIKKAIQDEDKETLQSILFGLRKQFSAKSTEALCNQAISGWDGLEIVQPKIGDKKKLLDLSIKNVQYHQHDLQVKKLKKQDRKNLVIEQLQSDLNLKELPVQIECFDNSNIQGTNPVASMVCFKNGKPSKNDYRKYNIKTVVGPDDFSSMKEIVGRRYKRLQEENLPFPQLIVIDGGKGQLNAACEALKEINLYGEIPIIGIAKRLEEIYYPDDQFPLHISKKSPSLKLLQHIRDEAHRFAITFHRNKRSKGQTTSELDNISGIGTETKKKLFTHFKSLTRMKQASEDQLASLIGHSKAQSILQYFRQKKEG
ncbi:excinuclease ABC subunit UvrC [Marinoscillum sp. MHG1-6]|uniref:excinuclease ABC subunit UvrC n=1 Tax=Marinoscillum sp. MHG1-6 TaxID=2959627 RepID=UPI00215771E9|nr:excinuclease ABC subunit UvrC [Marinoscillum sp. MHG1-6]